MSTSPSPAESLLHRVAVLGAGIAGLAAAYTLHRRSCAVTVFEAGDRPGGVIRSVRAQGFLVEEGPNSIQATTPLLEEYIDALELDSERVWASDAARNRFVVRGGTPQPLPTSPPALLTTSLFSARAKLRLLREPFIAPGAPSEDESVAAFTRRRLGKEVLDYAINPFVAGIFAGDPERLSMQHAFPALHEIEQRYGSLIGGQFKRARKQLDDASPRPTRRSFSFYDGLQTVTDALARSLGDAVRLATPVRALRATDAGWHVTTDASDEGPFEAVISTIPLHQLTELDLGVDVDVTPLDEVSYPPVSVVALGFRREDVAHPLDGFGVLVPGAEDAFQILGTLFSSTLFPRRAPDGQVLLTTLLGGARRPDLALASEEIREATVLQDLRALLGVRGYPLFVYHRSWPHAIPQYELGYGAVIERLTRLETTYPGLRLAGNYREGISVGDALASGHEAALAVLDTTPSSTA